MKAHVLRAALFSFLFLSGFFRPHAQAGMATHYPEIGQPLPDITLSEIRDYKLKKASTKDLKKKWVILDFWEAGCAACVKSFPHADSMQKKYGPELQIILVGQSGWGDDHSLHKIYEKYKARYNLNLANAYDSLLENYFGIKGYPYLVWIDNHGIVQAITDPDEVNDRNILAFLKGEKLNLIESRSAKAFKIDGYQYDFQKPIFLNDNGGPDSAFVYRSTLTKWTRKIPSGVPTRIGDIFRWNDMDVFEARGASLFWLYKLAYSGKFFYDPKDSMYQIWYTDPVLEMADPKPFDILTGNDKYRYCYNFIFPAEKYSPQYVQQALQRDLMQYFGYRVSIEKRMMPCWKLTCDESAKNSLRTKGLRPGPNAPQHVEEKFYMNDAPIMRLINLIWLNNQFEPPIVDETGIDFNIDLEVDCIVTDFEDLKKGLAEKGFHLEKGQKLMKVIVIKDSPNQTQATEAH